MLRLYILMEGTVVDANVGTGTEYHDDKRCFGVASFNRDFWDRFLQGLRKSDSCTSEWRVRVSYVYNIYNIRGNF